MKAARLLLCFLLVACAATTPPPPPQAASEESPAAPPAAVATETSPPPVGAPASETPATPAPPPATPPATPPPPPSLASQAAAALARGDLFTARDLYQAAVTAQPEDADLWRNLALVATDLHLPHEAVRAMERAVTLAPEVDLFHFEMGVLYRSVGQLAAAARHLDRALELDAGLAEAYWYRALVALEQGDRRTALAAADRARRLGVSVVYLEKRLGQPLPPPAPETPEDFSLRILSFVDREAAADALARLGRGEVRFEFLGDHPGLAAPVVNGGWAGTFRPGELAAGIREAVRDLQPFAKPVMVASDGTVLLVQRLLPWIPPASPSPAVAAPRPSPADAGAPLERTAVDPDRIRLYAGAFADHDRALAAVRRLRAQGFPDAFCLVGDPGKRLRYNAVAGQYDTLAAAQQALARLNKQGIDGFLSRRR